MQDLVRILELVSTDQISIANANQRVAVLETEPQSYHCGTCRFFRDDQCHQPGHPPRPEHPLSVRCSRHEPQLTDRDRALPYEPPRGPSKMFK